MRAQQSDCSNAMGTTTKNQRSRVATRNESSEARATPTEKGTSCVVVLISGKASQTVDATARINVESESPLTSAKAFAITPSAPSNRFCASKNAKWSRVGKSVITGNCQEKVSSLHCWLISLPGKCVPAKTSVMPAVADAAAGKSHPSLSREATTKVPTVSVSKSASVAPKPTCEPCCTANEMVSAKGKSTAPTRTTLLVSASLSLSSFVRPSSTGMAAKSAAKITVTTMPIQVVCSLMRPKIHISW